VLGRGGWGISSHTSVPGTISAPYVHHSGMSGSQDPHLQRRSQSHPGFFDVTPASPEEGEKWSPGSMEAVRVWTAHGVQVCSSGTAPTKASKPLRESSDRSPQLASCQQSCTGTRDFPQLPQPSKPFHGLDTMGVSAWSLSV
jgi:hypothetical protein